MKPKPIQPLLPQELQARQAPFSVAQYPDAETTSQARPPPDDLRCTFMLHSLITPPSSEPPSLRPCRPCRRHPAAAPAVVVPA